MAPNRYPQSADTPTHQSWAGQVGGAANVWQPADASIARPANTTAYAAHNAIGNASLTLFKFSNFFRAKGGSGILTGARLVANLAAIATSNMGAVRMHLFNAAPTVASGLVDQGAFMTLFADESAKLGWADFSSWSIGGTGSDTIESYGALPATPLPLIGAAQAADLYAVLEATGAFTPAASQVVLPYLAAMLD